MSKIFTHPQLQQLKTFVAHTINQLQIENKIRKGHHWAIKHDRAVTFPKEPNRIKRTSDKIARLEQLQAKIKYYVSGNEYELRREFTQRDLQSLQELLREDIRRLNSSAAYAKFRASELWNKSYKGARDTENSFIKMNAYRDCYRREKKREAALIELLRAARAGEYVAIRAQEMKFSFITQIDFAKKEWRIVKRLEKADFNGIAADVYFFYYHPPGASSPVKPVESSVEDGYVNMVFSHEKYPGRMFHAAFERASDVPFIEDAIIFEVRPNLLSPSPVYEIPHKRPPK